MSGRASGLRISPALPSVPWHRLGLVAQWLSATVRGRRSRSQQAEDVDVSLCCDRRVVRPSVGDETGMIWSLFAAVPLIARVESPAYLESEWCRREHECSSISSIGRTFSKVESSWTWASINSTNWTSHCSRMVLHTIALHGRSLFPPQTKSSRHSPSCSSLRFRRRLMSRSSGCGCTSSDQRVGPQPCRGECFGDSSRLGRRNRPPGAYQQPRRVDGLRRDFQGPRGLAALDAGRAFNGGVERHSRRAYRCGCRTITRRATPSAIGSLPRRFPTSLEGDSVSPMCSRRWNGSDGFGSFPNAEFGEKSWSTSVGGTQATGRHARRSR